MRCPSCGAENALAQRDCWQCSRSMQSTRADYFLQLAESQINKGNYDQASESLAHADRAILLIGSEERKQHLFAARAFWLQSSIYYNKGNLERARDELLDASHLLTGRDDGASLLAEILNRLGNISHYGGNIMEAMGYFRRSSELAIKVGRFATATKAINNLGNAYISLGDIGRAVECYSNGLAYAEQAGAIALAQAYTILAWLHSNYGPFSLALEYATKASALREQIENLDNRALILNQVGTVYLKYGDLDQAELYLRDAYQTVQRTSNKIVEEQILAQLAELVQQRNDSEAWQSYVMKAFRASSSSPYLRKESALQLINYYIKQGDLRKAERVHQGMKEAFGQTGGTGNRDQAIISHAAALIAGAAHDWDNATQQFRIALSNSALTTYEFASMWEEFGDMLLSQAIIEQSVDIASQARLAFEKASTLFVGLELLHRAEMIHSKLNNAAKTANTSAFEVEHIQVN